MDRSGDRFELWERFDSPKRVATPPDLPVSFPRMAPRPTLAADPSKIRYPLSILRPAASA